MRCPVPAPAVRLLTILLVLLGLGAGAAHAENANGDSDAELDLGREVFSEIAEPACGVCHVMADAGGTGTIAPDLDRLAPSKEEVVEALRSGPGAMPAYGDQLSDEEIDAVAEYVARIAGSS